MREPEAGIGDGGRIGIGNRKRSRDGGVPGVPGVGLWCDAIRCPLYVVDMDAVGCGWIGNDAVTDALSSAGELALLVVEA